MRPIAGSLVAAVLVGGCRCSEPKADASAVESAADAGPRASRGFRKRAERPAAEPLSPAQQMKLDKLSAQARKERSHAPLVPEFADRPTPKGESGGAALDVYVDGKRRRTVAAGEIARAGTPLDALVRGVGVRGARSVLVHGARETWIEGARVGEFQLRPTKNGRLKLESGDPAKRIRRAGAGRTGRGGGRRQEGDRPSKRDIRDRWDVRDVAWIEVRTPASERLASEP